MSVEQSQRWAVGDIFIVKLSDGSCSLGQVIDTPIPNTASCAFVDQRSKDAALLESVELKLNDVIAAATVVASHLDLGAWRVISRRPVVLPQDQWPNEATRCNRWIGSKVYTGAILEDFLNAYYALAPWYGYHDPHFMDNLLISPSKKPKTLLRKPSPWRA